MNVIQGVFIAIIVTGTLVFGFVARAETDFACCQIVIGNGADGPAKAKCVIVLGDDVKAPANSADNMLYEAGKDPQTIGRITDDLGERIKNEAMRVYWTERFARDYVWVYQFPPDRQWRAWFDNWNRHCATWNYLGS